MVTVQDIKILFSSQTEVHNHSFDYTNQNLQSLFHYFSLSFPQLCTKFPFSPFSLNLFLLPTIHDGRG